MARLHRVVKMADRGDTSVFTFRFPLPRHIPHSSSTSSTSFTTSLPGRQLDSLSPDFFYGHQRWSLTLRGHDRHIGAWLTLRQAVEGTTCCLDYAITALNRKHFSGSDSVAEKDCFFSLPGCGSHGSGTLMDAADLLRSDGFVVDGAMMSEVLVEVEMRNCSTTFAQEFSLSSSSDNHRSNFSDDSQANRFESRYFTFGGYDWSLSLHHPPHPPLPQTTPDTGGVGLLVGLTRQTSFTHPCRVRYRLVIETSDRKLDSGDLDQEVDVTGQSDSIQLTGSGWMTSGQRTVKSTFTIHLTSITTFSVVHLYPLQQQGSRSRAHLYDRDQQGWMIEVDTSGSTLRLVLFYADVRNVPRMYLRYVCFDVAILRSRGPKQPIRALGSPFTWYYSQMDDDEGFSLKTDISVEEMLQPDSDYLDVGDRHLTVEVHWIDSHLLHNDHHHHQQLSELTDQHRHQMKQELRALQAENYALEKQLFSYQLAMSRNNSVAKTNNGQLRTDYSD